MAEAKHTPGPWMVKGRVNKSLEAVRIESHHPAYEHHLYQVADVLDANGYPQNEANLLLIAAAPELLQALIDVLPYAEACIGPTWRANPPSDSVITAARTAIAKATGVPA